MRIICESVFGRKNAQNSEPVCFSPRSARGREPYAAQRLYEKALAGLIRPRARRLRMKDRPRKVTEIVKARWAFRGRGRGGVSNGLK